MKPANKIRRRELRERRRLEWGAARAAFLLAGGHKDWIVPFHMNWRQDFPQMTSNLEAGGTYYTYPRYKNYDDSSTTTGRVQQWRDEYPDISNAWNQAAYRK